MRAFDLFTEFNGFLALMGGRHEELATLMRALPTIAHLAKKGRANRRDKAALEAVVKDCTSLRGYADSRTVGRLVNLIYPLDDIFAKYDQMGFKTRMAERVNEKSVGEATLEAGEDLLTCVEWILDEVY